MDISLNEMLKLDIFQKFVLVAGQKGLKKKVTRIGLLDHEMIEPILGQFVPGEFALSTLLAAKDAPELIYTSVRYLIDSGASGLGVKDIYFEELPAEVLALAEANDFPIFMFDNSVYFEDVITEVKSFFDTTTGKVRMVQELLEQNVTQEKILSSFAQLTKGYRGDYRCFYLYNKDKDENIEEAYLEIQGRRLSNRLRILAVIPYKAGLFIIDKGESVEALVEVFRGERLLENNSCGISEIDHDGAQFHLMLKGAFERAKVSVIENKLYCDGENLGLYEILLPLRGAKALEIYMKKTVLILLAYDTKNNTPLFKTAEVFVQSGGQIKAVAKELIQHDNTIRYRLSKIRQLLKIEGSDVELYERLSMGFKIYWLEKFNH